LKVDYLKEEGTYHARKTQSLFFYFLFINTDLFVIIVFY